jgi:hypothetical protein
MHQIDNYFHWGILIELALSSVPSSLVFWVVPSSLMVVSSSTISRFESRLVFGWFGFGRFGFGWIGFGWLNFGWHGFVGSFLHQFNCVQFHFTNNNQKPSQTRQWSCRKPNCYGSRQKTRLGQYRGILKPSWAFVETNNWLEALIFPKNMPRGKYENL